eukprot:COSAG02_NODE_45118_length_360_cov_0.613027_1_plen_92_part_01
MENFSKQILRLGAMKGFRHVSFYLRGREELLVTVRSPGGTDGAVSAEQTVFLLAGYELYQRPYVWVRQPLAPCCSVLSELTNRGCCQQLRST